MSGKTCLLLIPVFFHCTHTAVSAQEGGACDPEPTTMSIQYGDLIRCTLESGTDRDLFRFSGSEGDITFFLVADGDAFEQTVAMMDVFDPGGSPLFSSNGAAEFKLPVSGVYSIRISELGADSTVPVQYTIAVDRIVPRSDFAARLCYGCSVSETLDPAGDFDLYYFEGAEGDVVDLEVLDPNSFVDAVAVVKVLDPNGTVLLTADSDGNSGQFTLVDSGEYTLRVSEQNHNDAMIPYTINLDCVGGTCVGQASPCSGAEQISDLAARGTGVTRLGGTAAFSFSIANLGGTAASGVSVSIGLPQGVELSNATPSQGTCGETNPVVCQLGQIDPRRVATLSVSAEIPAQTDVEIEAQVASENCDPDESNNRSALRIESGIAQQQTELFFPQFVDGTIGNIRFRTSLKLANTSDSSEVKVEFFESPDGEPFIITLENRGSGSSFDLTLEKGETVTLETTGTDLLREGYARVVGGTGLEGVLIYSRSDLALGVKLLETGVAVSEEVKEFSVFLDSLGERDTGVAFVNPETDAGEGMSAMITVRLFDSSFEQIGEEMELLLPPGGHRADFGYEFFSAGETILLAQEMEGLLTFTSNRPLYAVTLRSEDGSKEFPEEVPLLTTFPVIKGTPR